MSYQRHLNQNTYIIISTFTSVSVGPFTINQEKPAARVLSSPFGKGEDNVLRVYQFVGTLTNNRAEIAGDGRRTTTDGRTDRSFLANIIIDNGKKIFLHHLRTSFRLIHPIFHLCCYKYFKYKGAFKNHMDIFLFYFMY